MLPESAERNAQELYLANALVQVLTFTRGYAARETVDAIARTRALAEKSGNLAQLVVQVFSIWAAANTAGDTPRAAALADQVLDLAQREGSPTSLAFAHQAQMQARFYGGDSVGAEQHFALFSGYFEQAAGFRQLPGGLSIALGYASLGAWALGYADLARKRIAHAIALAHASKNPYDLAFGHFFESWLFRWLREPRLTEAAATEVLDVSEKHGFPYCIHLVRNTMGWARAALGSTAEGIALIRQGLAGMAEVGAGVSIPGFLMCLAEAQALDGKIDGALKTIDDALQANPDELVYRPQLLTCRGNLRRERGKRELAEADFCEAIALARHAKAKTLELHATTSLARLLRDANRRDEARTMLAQIYDWFTEGFDTVDLKDAKALIDELNR